MKTVAYNGSNKNFARVLFVVAALGGFWYLRRQGKSVGSILTTGAAGFKAAQGLINRVAPSIGAGRAGQQMQSTESVASGAQI